MPALYGMTACAMSYYLFCAKKEANFWLYRDDIGAFWGIKGYEEQVTEVGTHHGHNSWPQHRFLGVYDAGSVRRGFQVFAKNCGNCHGLQQKKYDALLDKGYKQLELAAMVSMFSIHPAHHHFKQYYYQEWDERDRKIEDRIYPPYFSQEQAKNANGGAWPTDMSKLRMRPGGVNYIYNILTGYHFAPPYGLDVPKGKHFNPYFDHMVIGMPRQLYDGMIDYDDGVPTSTPQMAFDVANFVTYMQRRLGGKMGDRIARLTAIVCGFIMLYPLKYTLVKGRVRASLSIRNELYAVRDGVYYNHFRHGQKNAKAPQWRSKLWA